MYRLQCRHRSTHAWCASARAPRARLFWAFLGCAAFTGPLPPPAKGEYMYIGEGSRRRERKQQPQISPSLSSCRRSISDPLCFFLSPCWQGHAIYLDLSIMHGFTREFCINRSMPPNHCMYTACMRASCVRATLFSVTSAWSQSSCIQLCTIPMHKMLARSADRVCFWPLAKASATLQILDPSIDI